MIRELKDYSLTVDLVDPHASADEVMHEYGIEIVPKMGSDYDAIVLAVGDREYREMGKEELEKISNGGILLFDIKGIKMANEYSCYWTL